MIYHLSARIDHYFVLVCRYADAFEHVDKEGKVELSDRRTMSIQLESVFLRLSATLCAVVVKKHALKEANDERRVKAESKNDSLVEM